MGQEEGGLGGGDIWIHITDLLHHTGETNIALYSNYTSMKRRVTVKKAGEDKIWYGEENKHKKKNYMMLISEQSFSYKKVFKMQCLISTQFSELRKFQKHFFFFSLPFNAY